MPDNSVTYTPVDGNPFVSLTPVDGDPFQQTMALQDYARTLPNVPAQPPIGQPGGAPLEDFLPPPTTSVAPQPAIPGLAAVAGDPSRSMAVRLPAAIGSSLADQGVGLAQSAWGAATLPGDVARGLVDPNSPEAVRRSTDLAGMLTLPTLDAGAVADPNALGIFAGAKAKTADLGALATAQDLAAKGADKTAIWNQTGWFTGADGAWRYEIPDNQAFVKGAAENSASQIANRWGNTIGGGYGGGAVVHPDLVAAYPEVADTRFGGLSEAGGTRGQFIRPDMLSTETNPLVQVSNALRGDALQSTTLHELQHGVQDTENFAGGYNPVEAAKDVAQARYNLSELTQSKTRLEDQAYDKASSIIGRANNGDVDASNFVNEAHTKYAGMLGELSDDNPFGIDQQGSVKAQLLENDPIYQNKVNAYQNAWKLARLDPEDVYKQTAGEVEARNVQSRMNMTPAQRQATPPWVTQDTPNEQQIIRSSPGGPQLSLTPVDHDPFAGTAEAQSIGANAGNAVSSAMPTKPTPPPVTVYHAAWNDFTTPDFSKLGESTLPNVEGSSIEPWAMNLAKSGFWTSQDDLSGMMGASHSLPFELSGNIKSYNSLDKLESAIRKAGGPEAFRAQMVDKGIYHAKVKDEEFGGTSYVTFDERAINRVPAAQASGVTLTPVSGNPFAQ